MKIPFLSYLLMKTSQFTRERVILLSVLLFQISSFSCISGQCLNDQRSLLLQLNSTLIYDSSFSTKLVEWNQNIDCCDWNGVECDRFGHVIGLELDNEMISGGIEKTSALYSFRYLHNLNLAYNSFSSAQIPREVGNLTNLIRLNLSNAEFGGQIPVELPDTIINMSNLSVIDISYCNFTGPIPSTIGNLSKLVRLNFTGNSFTGSIPIFSMSNKIEFIDLSYNDLNGSLSSTHFEGLSNLQYLDLRFNSLTGNIPTSLFTLPSLQGLILAENSFTGSIPIFSMSNKLESIHLSHNDRNGSLSSTHFEGLSNLQFLDLSDNSLTGNIPTSLFTLPSLQSLLLSDNKFSGQVNEFSTLNSSLESLDLRQNSLTGNIPTSLFTLPSLQSLLLSDNKFSGQVNEFSTLNSNLWYLWLNSNQLEGPIPKSFFRLEKLIDLNLSFNFFNETIQLEDFQTLQNLKVLYLGNNHLSVNISSITSESSLFPQLFSLDLASCNLYRFPNLRNQTNLNYLDLSNNKIPGDIPNWIWGNGSLYHLNLSHNSLVNLQTPYQIPSSIYMLNLRSNMLSGELPVPREFNEYLDYSSNNFQGQIPNDIGRFLSSTKFFSVANNKFSGEIPISLCSGNLQYLEVLDFSGNLLSGGLPPCMVQNITRLGVLNIERNNISGNIPDTFPAGCSLNTLDLSSNNLRGNIPPSLANCKSLKVMNVASNNLNGIFPCFLMNISSLHVLVLRSNELFGDIRCHGFNQSWPNLQIIDIAFNSFTGILNPGSILSLTGMKVNNSSQPMRNPLGLNVFVGVANNYYRDKVTVTLKGQALEIVKIFTAMTSIDLSSNKFLGAIPDAFGELSSLYVLSLSNNSFTGTIPRSLGNLKNLESLDLSTNELTGMIPTELTNLTSLSFFNISYNKLVGMIPPGPQFQTFTAASYEGNNRLCGFPVMQSCDLHNKTIETLATSTGEHDVNWMFILAGLGYAMGVALVVVPPFFNRRWGKTLDEFQFKLLKLVCSGYRG